MPGKTDLVYYKLFYKAREVGQDADYPSENKYFPLQPAIKFWLDIYFSRFLSGSSVKVTVLFKQKQYYNHKIK